MAITTYMTLTNRLLERLNEVIIAQSDFASTRGVQAMAKTVINSSIEAINIQEFEWPFNSAMATETLVAGTEEYTFGATVKTVKWDTFHLVKDASLGTNGHRLQFIDRDVRNRYLKNDDDNAGAAGLNVPLYVYPKHGAGFGISPSPDEAYEVTYEYFTYPVRLVAYDDQSTIPPMFDEAIIQGALYHFYMFRDNSEQADKAERNFTGWLGRMRSMLINNYDTMKGTIINRPSIAGGIVSSDYFR